MANDNFNGVRSEIVDRGTPQVATGISPNATFIIGTATKGPVDVPVRITTGMNVREIFGDVSVSGLGFDTSLVRGFYEFTDSAVGQVEVALVRAGFVSRSSIALYEYEGGSGELGPTIVMDPDGTQHPAYSLFIESVDESSEYNGSIVRVSADENNEPAYLSIELTDGTTASFQISPTLVGANIINKVSDLVNRINSNTALSGKIRAYYTPIEKTVNITITDDGNGNKQTVYNIGDGTWGDKLVSIKRAFVNGSISQTIAAGSLTATLDAVPVKSLDAGDKTISSFLRNVVNESVLTVSPTMVGASNYTVTLNCASVPGRDASYGLDNVVVKVKRNGSNTLSTLDESAYTVDETDAKITIVGPLSVGDVYYASYTYKVAYAEAKLRSELQNGNDRMYFVSGDQIIFGASQPTELVITYSADSEIPLSQVSIVDRKNAVIEFADASKLPQINGSVSVTILYEPELPAPTGTVTSTNQVQPGSMSGGSNGIPSTLAGYKKALKKALAAIDLYPRRHNVIMGMYLDDVENGYNEETGMPEVVPAAVHNVVLPYIARSSNLANECDVEIPVRPLTDLTPSGISNWITRLTVSSPTDITRPANIISSINEFRAEAPVGCFIYSNGNINNGREYFANPGAIYAAFKASLSYKESAVHKTLPGSVRDLGVKIFNAEVISALNDMRYTAAVMNASNQFIWADAPTLALPTSQFARQFVRDTVFLAVSLAREAASLYIGKPRLPQYLTTMRKDIYAAVSVLIPDAIGNLIVELIPDSTGYISGRTAIRLVIDTAVEIRRVDIITYVNLMQEQ